LFRWIFIDHVLVEVLSLALIVFDFFQQILIFDTVPLFIYSFDKASMTFMVNVLIFVVTIFFIHFEFVIVFFGLFG